MGKRDASDIRFEIPFYEKVLENSPNFIEALVCLGDLYTRAGLFEKGLRIDEKLAALRPDDAVVMYNLACSQSLMNDVPSARRTMVRAIELGYDEWDHLRKDPDLVNLLRDTEFQACLTEYLSRKKCRRTRAAGRSGMMSSSGEVA